MFFYGIKTIIKAKFKKKNKDGSFKFENICSVSYIYTLSQHRVVEVFNDENRLGIQCGINVEIWFGFQR